MINVLTMIFWSLFAIGLGTEYGEWLASDSDKMYIKLCQFDWYLLPIELQRVLIVVMLGGQKSIIVRGFGNIACARETFKKVIFLTFCEIKTNKEKSINIFDP